MTPTTPTPALADYTDPAIACSDCGLTFGESRLLGHLKLGKIVLTGPSPQIAEVAELPPLPEPYAEIPTNSNRIADVFTIEQMQSYARDAIAASRRATPRDVCAEMRALCSACGGTGDVVSLDGEWRGTCDCEASRAPASAGQAKGSIPKRAWSKEAEMMESWANLDAGQAGQVTKCWSCQKPYTANERSEADGHCPHCGVEIDLDDSDFATERAAAPAEQPSTQVKP